MSLALHVPEEVILAEQPGDEPLVEGLVARAFGPGRFAKAVERLREGRCPDAGSSFVAWSGRRAVGCVRLWPIAVGSTRGLLLGPIAVEADWRRHGVGADLVRTACDAAAAAGWPFILLVGDVPFFGPLGFSAAPARRLVLPGPVDPSRVLVRALQSDGALDLQGPVSAA
jgi:predicted N-acetyltransferase YhbS